MLVPLHPVNAVKAIDFLWVLSLNWNISNRVSNALPELGQTLPQLRPNRIMNKRVFLICLLEKYLGRCFEISFEARQKNSHQGTKPQVMLREVFHWPLVAVPHKHWRHACYDPILGCWIWMRAWSTRAARLKEAAGAGRPTRRPATIPDNQTVCAYADDTTLCYQEVWLESRKAT